MLSRIKKISAHLSSLVLLIAFHLATSNLAIAESFVIEVRQNGAPLSGVSIIGNRGVNRLPGRTTNTNGLWNVDTGVLSSTSPSIAFSKAGYRFEPAELTLTPSQCPGYRCAVNAIADESPSATIEWSVIDNAAQAVQGIPVQVPGAKLPCPKETDEDGYVFFVVDKRATACSDADGITSNDTVPIVIGQPGDNRSCDYSTTLTSKFHVCARNNFTGYAKASCISRNPTSNPGGSTSYTINVNDIDGPTLDGVSFEGNQGFENLPEIKRVTQQGKIIFSTADLSIGANDPITVVPVRSGYRFEPATLQLSPGTCPQNICNIKAWKSVNSQGALKIDIKETDMPFGGAEITSGTGEQCNSERAGSTDSKGVAVFPVVMRSSCDTEGTILFNAESHGCSFSHTSNTPFQVCPTSQVNLAHVTVSCSQTELKQYVFSGRVVDRNGYGLANVSILNSGSNVATSNGNGEYSLVVAEQDSLRLSASLIPYSFDPEFVSFNSISRAFSGIDFHAVLPNPNTAPVPDDPTCEAKPFYEISGTVLDTLGSPADGITIYNGDDAVAITDGDGKYAFTVAPGADLWVRADVPDADSVNFDPFAYSFPYNFCDRDLDFRTTEEPSLLLGGQVLRYDGQPYKLNDATVTVTFNGQQRATNLDNDGFFTLFAPIDTYYTISVSVPGATFAPGSYSGILTQHAVSLNFTALQPPTATPTSTSTPTFTPNPTATAILPTSAPSPVPTAAPTNVAPTAIPTVSQSRTPTPSGVPATFTASPIPTSNPSIAPSANPTIAMTATPINTAQGSTPVATQPAAITLTAAPSATQGTAAPSATATSTPIPTIAATRTFTSIPTITVTASPTATFTNTATFTATPSPTSTWTPTRTPTPSPTRTANPLLKVMLRPLCASPADANNLPWELQNQFVDPKLVFLVIVATNEEIPIQIPALTTVPFVMPRYDNNTVVLYNGDAGVRGAKISTVTHSGALCPTATPTRTPTNTPTSTFTPTASRTPTFIPGNPQPTSGPQPGPTSPPSLSPTVAPNPTSVASPQPTSNQPAPTLSVPQTAIPATPVATELPTETPLPTATPTATKTPIPSFDITGAIKGTNGRALSAKDKQRMMDSNLAIMVRENDSREVKTFPILDKTTFEFSASVPQGKYVVWLETNGKYDVLSQPQRYRLNVQRKTTGINFAVKPRTANLGKSSSRATAATTRRLRGVAK